MLFVTILLLISYGASSPLISKCSTFSLSISPLASDVAVNWRFNCSLERIKPDKFVFVIQIYHMFTHYVKDVIGKCDKCIEHTHITFPADTNEYLPYGWNHSDYPIRQPFGMCMEVYLKLYKNNVELDWQCLEINPNWMSRYKHTTHLRLGDLFIPGSHRSLQMKEYQRGTLLVQLVFGARYFDFDVSGSGVLQYVHGLSYKEEKIFSFRFLKKFYSL